MLMCFRLPGTRLRWLAGDDYARQVACALRENTAADGIHPVQGPELLSMSDALARFARAWPKRLRVVPAWRLAPRLLSPVSGRAHYMDKLLEMTVRHFGRLDEHHFETDLPRPAMTIEDYVAYIEATGDLPRKAS